MSALTLQEQVKMAMESRLRDYELEGVEITDEDVEGACEMIRNHGDVEKAVEDTLSGIRQVLDEGLPELDDEGNELEVE